MVKSYKELVAWQKGMELVRRVYALTKNFPKVEQYRLVDQLTRAAVSVPSNIAEGFGRSTNKNFAHFVAQARGEMGKRGRRLVEEKYTWEAVCEAMVAGCMEVMK